MRLKHTYQLVITAITLVVSIPSLSGQTDLQTWFFGDGLSSSGILFNGGNRGVPFNNRARLDISESNASLVENGFVRFFTNGASIVGELDFPMQNGALAGSTDAVYGSAILADPANCDQYYVFYTESNTAPSPRKLYYSIVDVTLERVYQQIFRARGDVVTSSKDIPISSQATDVGESIMLIDKDLPVMGGWLISSARDSRSIVVYDISRDGVALHGTYPLSDLMPGHAIPSFTTVHFNQRHTDLSKSQVVLAPSSEEGTTGHGLSSVTFDRATGVFMTSTAETFVPSTTWTYGTAFSPDGSKLYYSDHIEKTITQHDFITGNTVLIGTSTHAGTSGGLSLGPDDNIYWASRHTVETGDQSVRYLSIIQEPDRSGLACDLRIDDYDISAEQLPQKVGVFPRSHRLFLPLTLVWSGATCGLADGQAEVLADSALLPLTYQWDNGEVTPRAIMLDKGTHTVTITSLRGCTTIDTIMIDEVSELSLMDISSDFEDPSDCTIADGLIAISSPSFVQDSIYQITYVNASGEVISNTLQLNANDELILDNLSAGTYLTLEISLGSSPCTALVADSIILMADILPPDLGPDTLICEGNMYTIDVTESYQTYAWSTGSTASSIEVSESGAYSVIVTDESGCTAQNDVLVEFIENPSISLEPLIDINYQDSVLLSAEVNAGDSLSYLWTPPRWLSCVDCPETIARPLSSQRYTVLAMDENNCIDSASVSINVNTASGLFFPNIFTPNGDDQNDRFEFIVISEDISYIRSLSIYNRWGEQVYIRQNIQLTDSDYGWDGRSFQDQIMQGVYIYLVEVELVDGTIVYEAGDVLVTR